MALRATCIALGLTETAQVYVQTPKGGFVEVYRSADGSTFPADAEQIWRTQAGSNMAFSISGPGPFQICRDEGATVRWRTQLQDGSWSSEQMDPPDVPTTQPMLRIPRKMADPILVPVTAGVGPDRTKKVRLKRRGPLVEVHELRAACLTLDEAAGVDAGLKRGADYVIPGESIWLHLPPHREGVFTVERIEAKGAGAANVHLKELTQEEADARPQSRLMLECFAATKQDVREWEEQEAGARLMRRNQSLGTLEDLI